MELTPTDIELIDRFLKDELRGEELQAFKERMVGDSDFAAEVDKHVQSLQAINALGRGELLAELTSISKEFETTGNADNYRPGKRRISGKKGGSSGGLLGTLVFLGVIGVIAWTYFADPHKFESFFPEQQKINLTDTVFHYEVKRDTVYKEKKQRVKKVQRTDTIFYDESGRVLKDTREKIGVDTLKTSE